MFQVTPHEASWQVGALSCARVRKTAPACMSRMIRFGVLLFSLMCPGLTVIKCRFLMEEHDPCNANDTRKHFMELVQRM